MANEGGYPHRLQQSLFDKRPVEVAILRVRIPRRTTAFLVGENPDKAARPSVPLGEKILLNYHNTLRHNRRRRGTKEA